MVHIRAPRRLASALAVISLLGALIMPVAAIVIWVFWDMLAPIAAANLNFRFDPRSLGAMARLGGFTVFMVGALIQSYGLLGLRQTFLEASNGHSLSERALKGFRRFAWVSLIGVFYNILQHTLLILIISISDPSRSGALSIQLGSPQVQALFMALLLVFVAHVFAEGKQARDENAAFV